MKSSSKSLKTFFAPKGKKTYEESLQPMSMTEFNEMIDNAEEDSNNGRLISSSDMKKEIDSWA